MSSAARSGARTIISDDDRLPAAPAGRLRAAGFEPVEARTRLSLPTTTVRRHARLCADTDFADRTRAAGGPDDPLQGLFASALSSRPPLAPVGGSPETRVPGVDHDPTGDRETPLGLVRAVR